MTEDEEEFEKAMSAIQEILERNVSVHATRFTNKDSKPWGIIIYKYLLEIKRFYFDEMAVRDKVYHTIKTIRALQGRDKYDI